MKVLHVLEALEGGTARHLRDLVRFTPGVEQHVAVPARRWGGLTDTGAIEAFRASGAAVHIITMTRNPATGANIRAVGTVAGLVRQHGIDILHAHSSVGGAIGRAAAVMTRTPAVYTPNGLHDHRAALLIERALGPTTARLVAVSASEADVVRREHLVPKNRVVIIPNGIDPTQPATGPDLRALAGVPASAPLVASVGRLVRQKQPTSVVRTLARVLAARPDAYAILVGDGDLADEVRRALTEADEPRLRHLRQVPGVAAGLKTVDVVLLMSLYEGAPYIPLEAMRAGVPVVATDVVGTRDVIDDETGELVALGDEVAAADAVVRMLADPGRRARLSLAGPARISGRHSAVSMGAAHAVLYGAISEDRR